MSDYPDYDNPKRKRIEQAILDRLEGKSEHSYQWPRWAAAEEASYAVMALLDSDALSDLTKASARPPHPNTQIGRQ